MSRSILMTLLSQEAKRIAFTLYSIRIYGQCFAVVADLIATQKVKVQKKTDPKLLNFRLCGYDPAKNLLKIHTSSNTFPDDRSEESLLIHEAVHIINDLRCKALSLLDDEVVAHVAQAMYLLLVSNKTEREEIIKRSLIGLSKTSTECAKNTTDVLETCSRGRLQAAALIANDLLRKQTPSQIHLSFLRDNLSSDPSYKSKAKITNYNGIPGAPCAKS